MLTRLRAGVLKAFHRPLYFDGDYSCLESQDQKNIMAWLRPESVRGKAVLLVGIGNSGVARRLSSHAKMIDGITIVRREKERADSLGLPNYSAHVRNKYRKFSLGNKYDLIIDNNPTSYACCEKHLGEMFESYSEMLVRGGVLVTESHGLGHHYEGLTQGFDYDKLKSFSSRFGFSMRRSGPVYIMERA